MRFCQSFITELAHYIGKDKDVPAGFGSCWFRNGLFYNFCYVFEPFFVRKCEKILDCTM